MRLDLVAAWALSVSSTTSAVVAGAPTSDVADTRHSSSADTLAPAFGRESSLPTPALQAESFEQKRVDFAVPLQGSKYILSAVVSSNLTGLVDSQYPDCGNVQLSFPSTDGATLWTGSSEPIALEARDSQQHDPHTLIVKLSPYCRQEGLSWELADAVRAEVLSIDDTAFEKGHLPDFLITYHYSIRRQFSIDRVDVQSGSHLGIDISEDLESSLEHGSLSIPALSSNGWGKLQGLRDDNANIEARLRNADPSLDQIEQTRVIETVIVREELELNRLQHRLRGHRKLLNSITRAEYAATKGSFKDCHNWSCVFRSFYKKSKACVHNIYIRIVTFVRAASHREQECSRMASASPATQIQFSSGSSKSSKSCSSHRPDSKDYKLLTSTIKEVDSESDSDDASSATSDDLSVVHEKHSNTTRSAFDRSSASSNVSTSTTHRIHTVLASVLGLLCLSCLATHLHRRCCDPRLKADRAFRREERQARRELRRSAKRQAWKEWWARRLGLGCCACCDRKDKRVVDYEEKRRLFAPQEERLEGLMQDEIRFLTGGQAEEGRAYYGHTGRVPIPASVNRSRHEAEESQWSQQRHATRQSRANTGGSGGSNPESLPSYRSRDTSGSRERPPIYRTRASSLAQRPPSVEPELVSLDPVLAARLASMFPHVGRTHQDAEWMSRDGDETPDSSVVNVSPRLSSETLRTDRSVV